MITARYVEPIIDFLMVLEFALYIFVGYYIAQELSEFTVNKSEYMQDGWNIIDWINLLLLLLVLYYRVLIYMQNGFSTNSSVIGQLGSQGEYTDLTEYANYIEEIRAVNAFNAILIWFKTLKYVPFIPYVNVMMKTIKYSWRFFVSFIVIAFCIFMGFAVGFTGGFGDKFERLNSLDKTVLFLTLSFIGSSTFGDIQDVSPFWGGILILMFIILVYFVLLNLFFAIMVVALSEAKASEVEKGALLGIDKDKNKKKGTLATAWEMLEMDEFIERWFKGLHARREHKKTKKADLERRRSERKELIKMRRRITLGKPPVVEEDWDDGGPESPNAGRNLVSFRGKGVEEKFTDMGNTTDLPVNRHELNHQMKRSDDMTGHKDVDGNDSEESEIDIGILSQSKSKVRKKKMGHLSESEIILGSVQHIATVLARRSETMQEIVLEEMKEVKMICSVISDVLDILGRRANDLAKQQKNFIDGLGF